MQNFLGDLNDLLFSLENEKYEPGPVHQGKIAGINLAIELFEETVKDYKVIKVPKGGGPGRTIRKNLTRNQARRLVRDDMEKNPTGRPNMLVFDRM